MRNAGVNPQRVHLQDYNLLIKVMCLKPRMAGSTARKMLDSTNYADELSRKKMVSAIELAPVFTPRTL
jgi:hypothetical protein